MAKFPISFIQCRYDTLTNYQQLVLNFMLGCLSRESEAFVPAGMTIEVEAFSRKVSEAPHIRVRFYRVNKELINEHLARFPFKSDTQIIGRVSDTDINYGGLLIYNRQIGVRPVTTQELYIS